MTWIAMPNGRRVELITPEPDQFYIDDIARGLARQPRFAGHTTAFYSVAQHSVLASVLVEHPWARVAALLHDASEAYIGDLAKPIKRCCPDYSQIEDGIMNAIARRFLFQWPLPPVVKVTDCRLLATERDVFQPESPDWGEGLCSKYDIGIEPWIPEVAEREFLARFMELR